MNKIFKVIWSKARGCYVVASEFAKSHTKSGRAAKAAAVAAAVALTLGVNGLALAADTTPGEGNGVAIGTGSKTVEDTDTAIGKNAHALGEAYTRPDENGKDETYKGNTTAIGSDSKAQYSGSTAIGTGAQALGGDWTVTLDGEKVLHYKGNSTAVGYLAKATMYDSTAVGYTSEASGRAAVALGARANASGEAGVATGASSLAHDKFSAAYGAESKAYGEYGTALGAGAQTGLAKKYDADGNEIIDPTYLDDELNAATSEGTAVGFTAVASGRAATALGARTNASGEASTSVGASSLAHEKYSAAFGAESKAYGENGTALGAGAQTGLAKKYDADGKEIQYTEEELQESAKDNKIKKDGTAVGTDAVASNRAAAALGARSTASGDASIALGASSTASGASSAALGSSSTASGASSTALGASSTASEDESTALGTQSTASGKKSMALGVRSTASGEASVTLGVAATAAGDNSLALGTSSIVNGDRGIAIGYIASSVRDSIAIGYNSGASGLVSMALGREAKAYETYSMALGVSASASGNSSLALGYDAHAYNIKNVALGASSNDNAGVGGYGYNNQAYTGDEYVFTTSNGDPTSLKVKVSEFAGIGRGVVGTVSVGSDGQTRTLTNVAAGRISASSTDAINGSQLYNVIDSLPEQFHTVNGKDKADDVAADAPEVGKGYVGGNLLIKADQNETTGDITYDISLNKNLDLGPSGSVTMGDTTVNNTGLVINNGPSITKVGIDAGSQKIINVAKGEADTDAVNMSQLTEVKNLAGKHTQVTVEGGTKAGEGTDSNGNVYAGKNLQLHVTNDGGQLIYDLKLNNNLDLGSDGSVTMGDTTVNYEGLTINKGNTTYSDIVIKQGDVSFGNNKIINVVTDGSIDSSVVNVKYLKDYVSGDGNTDTHIKAGEYAVGADNSVSMNIVDQKGDTTGTVTITDVAKASDVEKIDQRVTTIEGDITTIKTDISNIGDRVTTVEGDITNIRTDISKIEKVAGAHTEVTVDGNSPKDDNASKDSDGYVGGNLKLKVTEGENGKDVYDIKMNNELDLGTDGSVTIGDTKIDNSGLTIKGDTEEKNITINQGDVSMGGNQIHNVADGTAPKDAVNVSQLEKVENKVINNSVQINKLGSRIDKVGAGAAALAALHPLDFDPDDKLYLSAGYGNYRGENAVAVGAFYQPNDDTLFSVSSTVGNDDDMINAGVTWRFGQSSNQSRSKKAMAKEIIELRTEVAELKAMVYSLTGYGMNMEKSKLFPDTPENHWAYDYVAVVAGNGILEGYPDGCFDGERPMTRYEMAAVVYRLLQKGVQVDHRMIQEFAPELARVRVDTLTHHSDGTPNIQRVRVIEGRG